MHLTAATLLVASLLGGPDPTTPAVQGSVSAKTLCVRHVCIGTPRSRLIPALGTPAKTKRGHDAELGMGTWEALYYRGLTVEVIKPEPGFLQPPPSEPYVWRIVITHSRWVTRSGLRVGQSRERALAILGAPAAEEQDGAVTTLQYYTKGFDGMFWIQLKKDVITELGVSEDWS